MNVIISNGPVNSINEPSSFLVGSLNLGHIPLSFNALAIQAELINVANDVAAAAPPQPPFNGQTHNKLSPSTFSKAAAEIIFSGVIESFVAMNNERQMLCANAAHEIAPLQ
jgi:hypothetical protein